MNQTERTQTVWQTEPELNRQTSRTELEHSAQSQWASCKNAARNTWETDVSQVQYVTNTRDTLSINCESACDVPVLWLLKAIVF